MQLRSSYTWSPGGAGLSIAVSPTTTSTYTINGTDANGCMNSSVFTQSVSLCTSLAEALEVNEVRIYPNPFNDIITITFNKTETIQVSIYNAIGEQIASTPFSFEEGLGMRIDLSHQSSGIYFVRIGSLTKKIIKE